MSSRTCLITGATSGIGRATAMALGRSGWTLWLVGRDERRGDRAIRDIEQLGSGATARFFRADISSLAEVRELAAAFRRESGRLDLLVNNAGARIMQPARSVDGIELTFATNHLGHFLLTCLLADLVVASGDGQVINVASSAHSGGTGDYETVLKADPFDGRRAYAESKLANVLFTTELAKRLGRTGVRVRAVDPGGVATRFARNNGWLAWCRHCFYYLKRRSLLTPSQGCETILWLAVGQGATAPTGGYYARKQPAAASKAALDPVLAKQLWALSLRMVQLTPDERAGTFQDLLSD